MPCPTCDHTMSTVGRVSTGSMVYWCQRCGTMKQLAKDGTEYVDEPRLPVRVREFLDHPENMLTKSAARRIGLYESCMIEVTT